MHGITTRFSIVADSKPPRITTAFAYSYDELGQLKEAQWGIPDFSNRRFSSAGNRFKLTGLNYDANGNIGRLKRYGQSGGVQDDFTYSYFDNTNRLKEIPGYASYTYDDIGRLKTQTKGNKTMQLGYNVSSRVKQVTESGSGLQMHFTYDDRGFRLSKKAGNKTTYYIRDAGGQVLGIYEKNGKSAPAKTETPIYGSSRLGMLDQHTGSSRYMYELKDHLGNVRAVVQKAGSRPNILAWNDYYPFGSLMRRYASGKRYRFGYQGDFSEEDAETGWNAFEARMYDAKIGRWLSTDPARQFASPYVGMGNNPVMGVDPNGEEVESTHTDENGNVVAV
ncbi:MAG: hypothetical protein MI784_17415, partial [Cytophagales bacterium]|nr:hypothetical protein [Cytophagales bacterium]